MSRRGKRRSRPRPDASNAKRILYELEKTLMLNHKYKTNLLIANIDETSGEVALTSRDSAVQSIRFLKFWLRLPSETFFTAVNLLDRFLTKMKVQEKFLSCVSISCLYTAAQIHSCNVNAIHLLNLSQTRCSIKDMYRMCDIIRKKLDIESREQPITVYTYLNIFLQIMDTFFQSRLNTKTFAAKLLQKKMLQRRLEVIMTNYQCASERAPVIALALLRHEMQRYMATETTKAETIQLLVRISELECVCMVTLEEFRSCTLSIDRILQRYDDHCKMSNIQKMKWQFSSTTLFALRPLDKFRTNLNRINEDI